MGFFFLPNIVPFSPAGEIKKTDMLSCTVTQKLHQQASEMVRAAVLGTVCVAFLPSPPPPPKKPLYMYYFSEATKNF